MNSFEIVDVQGIQAKKRLATIIEKFNTLSKGESFVLQVNYDPKSFYKKLMISCGTNLKWENLVAGPFMWKVLIVKKS